MSIFQQLKIFSGSSNPDLAGKIASQIGVAMGSCHIQRFSDGEIFVQVEENVRGMDVFIVQPTCSPANEHYMEMLIMIDAMKRASADRITVVVPYYGYARQDRKVQPRTPITSKLIADLITAAGADRILAMDLHAGQIQGFFDIPFDHLFATPVFLDFVTKEQFDSDLIMVSPDAGGTERARAYAKRLNCELAIVDKRRTAPNRSEVMNIIGDVSGRTAILVDDIVDTAGTLTQAAKVLVDRGAKSVYAICTHPVLSGQAVEKINESPIRMMVVSDTIPLGAKAKKTDKIRVLTVSRLLAEAIRRIHTGDSVSSLFV